MSSYTRLLPTAELLCRKVKTFQLDKKIKVTLRFINSYNSCASHIIMMHFIFYFIISSGNPTASGVVKGTLWLSELHMLFGLAMKKKLSVGLKQ